MRVLVAGSTGVVGRQLVPRLVERGHEVVGTTSTSARAPSVAAMGAEPAVLDALDAAAVHRLVHAERPDVIVHQLTALSGSIDLRHFDRSFAATNRLRTEATDSLLAAGREVGISCFVAQSFAGWPSARTGDGLTTEDVPLDDRPLPAMRETLAAIRHLERAVLGATWTRGVVLRYGALCGPGTSLEPGGEHAELIRRRRFPVVGDGAGVWSFVDTRDAAAATVAAVERQVSGVYNVVDDEPAPVAVWLPAVAHALGARPPLRVPRRVGRLLGGPVATMMTTDLRGVSNAKARAELGWTPEHPTWRGIAA